MKFNRIIFATVAGVLALASCSKVKNEITTSEYDPSKTPVASLTYIEEGSSDTKAVFEIDGVEAIKAGATSFTILLATSMDDEKLGNGAFFKNIDAAGEEPFQITLSSITGTDGKKLSLAKGDLYIPMIRANYPPFIHSDWTKVYAAGSDRLALEVGYGMKAVTFEQPEGMTATASDETITATWRRVPYAESYTIEYKKCSENEWQVIDGIKASANKYTITGLVDNTEYDVRVKAVKADDATEYTAITKFTEKTCKFKTKGQVIEFFTSRAAQADAKSEFTLENDIDMEGATVPAAATFAAKFDGKGHALKNLKITEPLFTENNGTIANLVIDASCTIAPASTIFAPVVLKNAGTVKNVVNKADIKFESNEAVADGALMAGIAVYNNGTAEECVNDGIVSYVVNAPSGPWGIAGIAAVNGGAINKSVNNGKVVSYADYCSEKKTVGELSFKVVGCTGGIVAYETKGATVTGATNNGEVDYLVRAMNLYAGSAGMNRNQIAGIVAAPDGDITDCTNNGAVNARLLNQAGTSNAKEYLAGVGGISGGDYFASNGQINTNITGCINHGKITMESNHSGTNNTAGGIVAWPGAESKATTKTSNCQNDGDIFLGGTMKVRAGGIMGGSGNVESCQNSGNIHVGANINSGSVVGSVCGFHSGGYTLMNCSAFGSVVSEASINGCGGLSGSFGNAAMTITGCVNCELTNPNSASTGLVVGAFGGTKAITCGDAGSPIKVAGKVNGVAVSADNVEALSHGTTSYSATSHTFFVAFGE